MESLGINVSAARKWESFRSTLAQVRSKHSVSPYSSSGKLDFGTSEISSSRSKHVPLSAFDGIEQRPPSHRSSSIIRGAPSFILLVIDASAGPFNELYGVETEFKRGLHQGHCKVVWLDYPTSRSINPRGIEEELIDDDDEILVKPSRLYHIISLLPEFGGNLHYGVSSAKTKREPTKRGEKVVKDPTASSSAMHIYSKKISEIPSSYGLSVHENMLAEGSLRREIQRISKHFPDPRHSVGFSEIEQEEYSNQSSNKPLHGVRFLVAEDHPTSNMIAKKRLSSLGASIELCENGEEAVERVLFGLQDQRRKAAYPTSPYDYILMDCEMPKMNGYEASRQLRNAERCYNIHIPIIAVTAHSDEEDEKTRDAGIDLCMRKPLDQEALLEAIRCIRNK